MSLVNLWSRIVGTGLHHQREGRELRCPLVNLQADQVLAQDQGRDVPQPVAAFLIDRLEHVVAHGEDVVAPSREGARAGKRGARDREFAAGERARGRGGGAMRDRAPRSPDAGDVIPASGNDGSASGA